MRACPSLQIVIIFPILPRFIHNSVYYTNLAACLKQFCMIFSSITQKTASYAKKLHKKRFLILIPRDAFTSYTGTLQPVHGCRNPLARRLSLSRRW